MARIKPLIMNGATLPHWLLNLTEKEMTMPFDLIYTRKPDASALSFDAIVNSCPAVLTETKSPDTSGRYGFVSTYDAMQVLGDYGYRPTQALQRPSRKVSGLPYAQHMLSFAKESDLLNPDLENRPEILLYNSHDGRSALKLFAGCYRFVCSNGIIAGDGFNSRMLHSKRTANNFESLLKETIESLPQMVSRIETMQNTKLNEHENKNQILDFVKNAATLRWEMQPEKIDLETKNGVYFNNNTFKGLSRIQRYADSGGSAWQVFNVVQENLLGGGAKVLSITQAQKDKGRYWGTTRKAKAVSGLPEIIRLNRNLWDLSDALVA